MEYKIFSFSTTIRNPQRNITFLNVLKNFNGFPLTQENTEEILNEFVKTGVYRLTNSDTDISQKISNNKKLSNTEIERLFKLNPHLQDKKAKSFRGKTHLDALVAQGLLLLLGDKCPYICLTPLALELMDRKNLSTDIYTKLMLGLHFHNPNKQVLNKARPFLNTLFVLNELKKSCKPKSKGLLRHEFKSFVLGMKDCDYETCTKEILKYRSKFGFKENKSYLHDYLFKRQKLKKVKDATLDDYADEVFRKFSMTGLITSKRTFKNIYYDLSQFNYAKIQALLESYKNYDFREFKSKESYIDFLCEIQLPWEVSTEEKIGIIKQKAKNLNLKFTEQDFENLQDCEEKINSAFKTQKIKEITDKHELNELIEELKILAKQSKSQSRFKELDEPLRLEYILALVLAKKYGNTNLVSNLIYGEDGLPLSFAPALKTDLEYEDFLIEATMIKNKNQQLNSETTSIIRHMQDNESKRGQSLKTFLVAPYIHRDVALFFKFCAKEFESPITALTIGKFIGLLEESSDFTEFRQNYQKYVQKLLKCETKEYTDFINS